MQILPLDELLTLAQQYSDAKANNGIAPCNPDFLIQNMLVHLKENHIDKTLDEKMLLAGMIPVSEILKGSPMDKWHVNTGVVNLDSFGKWLDMKYEEMLRLKARIELKGDAENNELYEWALSHCAVLTAVRCNFRNVFHAINNPHV